MLPTKLAETAAHLPRHEHAAWTGLVKAGFGGNVLVTVARGSGERVKGEIERVQPLVAPIAKGQQIGTLRVKLDDKVISEQPLIALEPVAQASGVREEPISTAPAAHERLRVRVADRSPARGAHVEHENRRFEVLPRLDDLAAAFAVHAGDVGPAVVQVADDRAHGPMARLQQTRFDRGKFEAMVGEPPTEGSSEYRRGYAIGTRERRDG